MQLYLAVWLGCTDQDGYSTPDSAKIHGVDSRSDGSDSEDSVPPDDSDTGVPDDTGITLSGYEVSAPMASGGTFGEGLGSLGEEAPGWMIVGDPSVSSAYVYTDGAPAPTSSLWGDDDELGAAVVTRTVDGTSYMYTGAPGAGAVLVHEVGALAPGDVNAWDTAASVWPDDAGTRFGASLAVSALNDDERVLVSAPESSQGASLWSYTQDRTVVFDAGEVRIGDALAYEDVNGDGENDVIVSSVSSAAVFVWQGPFLDGSIFSVEQVDVEVKLDESLMSWGSAVVVGDLFGDGYGALAVGAPDEGRVTVHAVAGTELPGQLLTQIVEPPETSARLGASLSVLPDSHAQVPDGFDDLVVGAPGLESDTGTTWVLDLSGQESVLELSGVEQVQAPEGPLFGIVVGDTGDYFGQRVLGRAWINNNTFVDLLVAAPGTEQVRVIYDPR